ncbi:SDR family oxidoreductase [Phenylobacterium sp.]|jgi:NAD(P)-dependent dehydrogenase (short-subunit alcohol dehydrogenase family)|uniref:SDR family oxidoreductase n=1 Tax=Phenylobacterium sp. TaxID=1871053 RepID=UPI002F41D061
MEITGRVIVITGAASGIGAAMARRFAAEGAHALVLGDIQADPLGTFGEVLRAAFPAVLVVTQPCDVTREADIQALAAAAIDRFGRIDIYCSNAGLVLDGDESAPDEVWTLNWNIHVMANVWAARAVIPDMAALGEGYFLITASAAGLLTSLPSASYAVTKHAAIALAEKLAIDHGDHGIRVSALCPQAVDTPLMQGRLGKGAALDGVATPEEVADCVVRGLADERFLILPHPKVRDYFAVKATDYERWLAGMRRGLAKVRAANDPG